MDLPLIILIGISLSMDCFAVSLAAATSTPLQRVRLAIILGVAFGSFQAGMMLLGWGAGTTLIGLISGIDHWIAFIILSLIGGKMIYEGIRGDSGREHTDFLSLSSILILAVATSIDSLGVGLSLGLIAGNILLVALAAGIISFLFASSGAMLGGFMSEKFGEKIEILGGVILIGIGLKILLEHLSPI